MFRFSLKWILAAMVYAAIAAAAFSQQSWVYADLLCAFALLALGYAILLAIYTRGPRQAAAVGFITCAVLVATCMVVAPESVPTLRVVTATGLAEQPILPAPTPGFGMGMPASGAWALVGQGTPTAQVLSIPTPLAATGPAIPTTPMSGFDITFKLRAANAVGVMLAGLLGIILGLIAYRRAHRESSTPLAA